MCLGTVVPGTIEGYTSHIRAYSRFCATRGLDPSAEVVIEKYLFHLFKSNADPSAALQFRPALRKAAKASGVPDPFPKGSRLSLMVNTFSHDIKLRIVKCIPPASVHSLVEVFGSLKTTKDKQASLLFMLTLSQGMRIASICDSRFNDFFIDESMLYIHKAKGHKGPIFTLLHPDAANVIRGFIALFPGYNRSDKLSEGWDAPSLNLWLESMCRMAGIKASTWHCGRHSFAQFLSDLGYPNDLTQALGTWKCITSLKSYVRVRSPFQFPPEVVLLHKGYILKLSSLLRRQKGKMLWFSSSSS
jgi:site-specific recombinase XerD